MRPLKTLGILSITPVLQCSACRDAPSFSQLDLRPQCIAPNAIASHGFFAAYKRFSTPAAFARPSSTATSSVSQRLTYRIGSSFSAKGRRFKPKEDSFSFDPDNQLASKDVTTGKPNSGQDAFFIGSIRNGSNVAFGVADGVGGWADSGIDSAHFSHGLCHAMALEAQDNGPTDTSKLGPRELLDKAYQRTITEGEIAGGGSTACVAIGNSNGTLTVANLGDSGFVHLRLNRVHHYSNPQTHAFNTPFQLSIVPPKVLALSRAFGGQPLSDLPRDASVTTHDVRHGDVLILATDGVWDNLSSMDVLRIVSRQMMGLGAWTNSEKEGTQVSDEILGEITRRAGKTRQKSQPAEKSNISLLQTLLAVHIVGEAKAASENSKADGPFAREVQRYYPQEDFHGGKVDDICVVVAVVVSAEER